MRKGTSAARQELDHRVSMLDQGPAGADTIRWTLKPFEVVMRAAARMLLFPGSEL